MGRCVVIMGMPFPNPTDPELCERMHFMDSAAQQSAAGDPQPGSKGPAPGEALESLPAACCNCAASFFPGCRSQFSRRKACGRAGAASSKGVASSAGREYFEDLCMKAVNQCIGRVIRHGGDWAAILLVDQRWTAEHPAGKASALSSTRDSQWASQRYHTMHRTSQPKGDISTL